MIFYVFCDSRVDCTPPGPMILLIITMVWGDRAGRGARKGAFCRFYVKTCEKHKKHAKINNFPKITKFSPFSAKLLENLQNDAEISFWRILVVPWPPHAENLNIPIGLLRFLTLPGRPETLQKAKKKEKTPKS